MKRCAVLIGANDNGKLPGVFEDMAAWKDFLLSPTGGAWAPEEIFQSKNPETAGDVDAAVATACGADYAFVVFSGHGFGKENQWGFWETNILLNSDEYISEYRLNPGKSCPRCTIVLDCCRSTPALKKQAFAMESCPQYDKMICRLQFDLQLQKSDFGCAKIYATASHKNAADKESFSRIIIEASRQYFYRNPACHVLDLQDAVELAKARMRIVNPQQVPEYCGGRRNHHFPFAVQP